MCIRDRHAESAARTPDPLPETTSCGDGWHATTIVEQSGGSCLSSRTTGDDAVRSAVDAAESTATTGSTYRDVVTR